MIWIEFYFYEKKIPFNKISQVLKIPLTTIKRWASSKQTPRPVGRPTVLTPSEEKELKEKIIQSAVERIPLTTEGLQKQVSFQIKITSQTKIMNR
jgi:hypothetical protein